MRAYPAAATAVVLLCTPRLAQDPASVSQPQPFVDMATVSNMCEIGSSKVALEKGGCASTKQFARHMIMTTRRQATT